jgi:putative membrane protein
MRFLLHWIVSALCVLVVARLVPGISVRGFGTALLAALAIGVINGTLGVVLKLVSLPLIVLSLGLFWWVINAVLLKLAALVVPGFSVQGFWPALWGALALSVLNLMTRWLVARLV